MKECEESSEGKHTTMLLIHEIDKNIFVPYRRVIFFYAYKHIYGEKKRKYIRVCKINPMMQVIYDPLMNL